ncbi:LD-carboxypeptidase [Rubrivivax gelatinosus]|nr:LD-carboxypeptidase [Rubrivivax gelatinosus]
MSLDSSPDGHDHGPGCGCEPPSSSSLVVFSPAGAVQSAPALRRAARHLGRAGFEVTLDASALARVQRFAGDDDIRLAAIHRVAEAAPAIALAARGGYGTTRLLDRLDWQLLARSVERGTRWVGHSDLTALQLGLLAHGGTPSWAGPLAADFGRSSDEGGVDDVTEACFVEAMSGELEAVGFRTEAGFDGLGCKGVLWGGNLTVLCSLLGTPHWPKVKGGVLFLEDVAEHPYRVERMLLQLLQAGVLGAQKAVLLGSFSDWKPVKSDRGYKLKTVVEYLRKQTSVPILTGLPFGHVPTKVTLPVGAKVELVVQGRDALVGW